MDQVTALAYQIRGSRSKASPLSISASFLRSLLASFETIDEQSSSAILVRQNSNSRNELLRDLHFLQQYIQEAKALKLYEDKAEDRELKDISKLTNLISIEFFKVDVNTVKGLQTLRSQLQKLVCHQTMNNLEDVLSKCGSDESNAYCWSELKEIVFTKNEIVALDSSLECVPWLHTLDLSHNHLKNIPVLNCLPNLKCLNLSFNKLETVPRFKGQICIRLQNLVLKNNFIEDITGLQSLINLTILDLSNNCLLNYKSLLPLSYLATLQWLNLNNNPLSFHPHHRNKTASCFHLNTMSTNFILNFSPLSNSEKKVIGSLFPTQSKNYSSFSSNDSISLSSEKICKVREVTIEEEAAAGSPSASTPPITRTKSQQHLETKKQIENLHEQYGESWLNAQSGVLLQNVLGLEGFSVPVSSSPYEADFTLHSDIVHQPETIFPTRKETLETLNKTEDSYVTAREDKTVEEDEYNVESDSEISDGDLELQGEENIFLATCKGETEPILIVITAIHLSEKECSTGGERARWHLNSVINCEVLPESDVTVQLDFDTMRKDRKRRIYVFEEDVDQFVAAIKQRILARIVVDETVRYQCMKCDAKFTRMKNKSVLGEPAVTCPTCDSNLVVEDA